MTSRSSSVKCENAKEVKLVTLTTKVTIADVARRAGVPYATVWRLLTGGGPRVPQEVRQKVMQALVELEREAEAGVKGN